MLEQLNYSPSPFPPDCDTGYTSSPNLALRITRTIKGTSSDVGTVLFSMAGFAEGAADRYWARSDIMSSQATYGCLQAYLVIEVATMADQLPRNSS